MSLTDDLRRGYASSVALEVSIPELTLPQMVEKVARQYPQHVALDFFSRPITYAQLADRVRHTASVLTRTGVAPGDCAALMVPSCPQHVIAILTTMTLGGIVVEHNPLSPVLRIEKEFETHGARVIIAWERSVDELVFLKDEATVFSVDLTCAMPGAAQFLLHLPVRATKEKRTALSAKPPTWTRFRDHEAMQLPRWLSKHPANPGDPAFLIHTGDVTGIPKGATLTHRNILANIAQSIAWVLVLHEGTEIFYYVLPLFHAFGFIIGLSAGLHLGAGVALFLKFDTTMILTSRKRLLCTFFLGVPPIYEHLLKTAKIVDADLSSMTFSLSGAVPLPGELAKRWGEAINGLMVEGYGMTGASPITLGSLLSNSRYPSALGIPFPSTQVRIIDPEDPGVDVPESEIGELVVKGPQIFSDYWERPEETAEALWNGRLCIGNLVRVQGGFIHMADRRREMVDASGFNVYPSQAENAVRNMSGVRDIVVIDLPAGNAGKNVATAIALGADAPITLADACRWTEKSIVRYAPPHQIVVMTELPRSQLGEVMRKKVCEQILDTADSILTAAGQVRNAADQTHSATDQVRSVADSTAASVVAKLHNLKNRE